MASFGSGSAHMNNTITSSSKFTPVQGFRSLPRIQHQAGSGAARRTKADQLRKERGSHGALRSQLPPCRAGASRKRGSLAATGPRWISFPSLLVNDLDLLVEHFDQ